MYRFLFVLLPLVLITTGCFHDDDDDISNAEPDRDYSGTYQVTGATGDEVEVRTWTFTQAGSSIIVTDESGLSSAGTVSGNIVTLSIKDISEEFFSVSVTVKLVFSEDGTTFTGSNLDSLEVNGSPATITGVKVS